MTKTARRLEREAALKELYRLEYDSESKVRLCGEYACRLIDGVREQRQELDKLIKKRLKKSWPFKRIALMDVLIMRIAIYEILEVEEVDAAISINEALELVREFSEEKSVAFVNGVLDGVGKEAAGGGPLRS